MPQPVEQFGNRGQMVNIRGRNRPYLECRRIRRRDYFLLERIGRPFRESYHAFDRLAGPRGSFFLVQSLPVGKATEQLLSVLSRFKSDAFPRVVDWTTRRIEGDGHHRCYAAPELQTGTTPISLASDQFSVSVLLFELLTLNLPYGGLGGKAGRPEFVARAADTLVAPSQISSSCQQLPRSLRDRLDALVLRGLSLNPVDRYPDHNPWLNDWQELIARFRITPELPPIENALTRVIGWFVN